MEKSYPRYLTDEEQEVAARLLYIVPREFATKEPLIDDVTLKMMRLWRSQRKDQTAGDWRGFHGCVCGAYSSSRDHVIRPDERTILITNSLCVHYLAHHRDEVPRMELAKILCLPDVPHTGDEKPTLDELQGWRTKPDPMKTRFR